MLENIDARNKHAKEYTVMGDLYTYSVVMSSAGMKELEGKLENATFPD